MNLPTAQNPKAYSAIPLHVRNSELVGVEADLFEVALTWFLRHCCCAKGTCHLNGSRYLTVRCLLDAFGRSLVQAHFLPAHHLASVSDWSSSLDLFSKASSSLLASA